MSDFPRISKPKTSAEVEPSTDELMDEASREPVPMSASDLDELMSRNPLELTEPDLDALVLYYRKQRARKAAGEKPTKDTGPKMGLDEALATLIKASKPQVDMKRRV